MAAQPFTRSSPVSGRAHPRPTNPSAHHAVIPTSILHPTRVPRWGPRRRALCRRTTFPLFPTSQPSAARRSGAHGRWGRLHPDPRTDALLFPSAPSGREWSGCAPESGQHRRGGGQPRAHAVPARAHRSAVCRDVPIAPASCSPCLGSTPCRPRRSYAEIVGPCPACTGPRHQPPLSPALQRWPSNASPPRRAPFGREFSRGPSTRSRRPRRSYAKIPGS